MAAKLPDGWRTTSFRFTLEPTVEQRQLIARHLGAARFAWNQSLGLVKDALDARATDGTTDVPWTPFSIINAFNAWKRSPAAGSSDGLPWRGEVHQGVMEEACVDLGRALGAVSGSRNGTRKGARMGFPRFTKRGRGTESCRFRAKDRRSVQVGSDEAARVVKLPRIGVVRVREDTRRVRRLMRRGARPLQATLRRDGRRLVVAITLACPPLHQAHHHRGGGPAVGLDRGLTALVVGATADGDEIMRVENPRHLTRSLRQLRRANRAMFRRRRGSRRRERARRRVARLHQRARDQRNDVTNKLTTDLATTHGRIVVETLGIRGLVRTRLARAISDAAWGDFERQLDYKLAWRSGELIRAPRWLPSTRACSACGEVGPAVPLSEQTFTCSGCGHSADRDTDAAAVLAAWADGRITLDAELEDRRPEVPGDAKRSLRGEPAREVPAGVFARPGDRTRSPLAGTAEKAAVSELAA
ncbi:RNA-guided endonuclease TnpB family protein [Miltoncostaea marina]|uniref:RNA-guided endonuclease TnpB family protein n=1 Tax=Miltoncostaea marina TaxID=2843215 RepID=UPI001C3D001E|nr:RNA-guided endonuclease TnpB family protein [Miltoncostaea marina]